MWCEKIIFMALFRKRKKVKEENDPSFAEASEGKGERGGRRLSGKSIKDLNPKNRKKRKEPKKPWGKGERYFVLFILLITAGTSGFLALSSRSWKVPGLPRVSFGLPKVSLPFLGEDTIVIEGNKKDWEVSEKVITGFNDLTKDLSGVYGLYVINLQNGASFGMDENEKFEPASLNKLPVILGLYMEEETGNLDLNTKYTLKNSDKLQGSGSLYSKPVGMVLTYRELIRYMCKESDNTAFNIARRILGDEKIERVIKAVGMQNTAVLGDEQKTTPKDVGLFFQRLYEGGLINSEHRDEFLDFLTDTIYEDHLAAGVPPEVRIAHKYGRELHVVNDAGIVFSENSYVIVILSKGVVDAEADRIFPEISKLVYEEEVINN